MVDFELDMTDLGPVPEIEITEDDLRAARPLVLGETIEITDADLAFVRQRFAETRADWLVLSLDDIRAAQPPTIDINFGDLPAILELSLADLRGDLTGRSTDCFHGTSLSIARKIQREGFRVGSGALSGSGIYFSVGGIGIATSYVKSSEPCIIRARIDWGKVAYLDDKKLPSEFRGGGDRPTQAALRAGYHSFITSQKYSKDSPAVGIILQTQGGYVRPPRIEVIELLNRDGKPIH